VQIPCRSLNIRERCGIGRSKKVEILAAHERKAQVSEELFIMGLTDAKEVHDLAVEIVQHLHLRRRLMKEHLRASGKGFHVRLVLWKELDHSLRQRALPSDI